MAGKGASFEREICKELSAWWTDNARTDVFWRTSISGGRAKVRSRQGKSTFGQYGDIQATDPIGQPLIDFCTIELKRGYKGATVGDMLDKGAKSAVQPWEKWVSQAIEDHKNAGTPEWMLITKRDRRGVAVFMPVTCHIKLLAVGAELHSAAPSCRLVYEAVDKCGHVVYGIGFSDFINLVKPEHITAALGASKEGDK